MAEVEIVDGQVVVVDRTYRSKEQIQVELDNYLTQESNMEHQLSIVKGLIIDTRALLAAIEASTQ